ncbi:hypothetical protein FRB91_007472 [Serendipita sp. 411]|nr:hypothetical protein FRB91_007472 [Serendipita sp. 411]
MVAIQSIALLGCLLSVTVATPIAQIYQLRAMHADPLLESRQEQPLTAPVTFQTVTTSQTPTGLITQTCNVTLTPITGDDGVQAVRQEKQCKFDIASDGQSSPPSNGNGDGNSSSTETLSPTESITSTEIQTTSTQESQTTSAQETLTTSSSSSSESVTATVVPAISEIGTGVIPASGTTTVSGTESTATESVTGAATATATGSAPLAVSVIGTGQISDTGLPSIPPSSSSAATGTEPITVVTTLSNGQVTTAISTPSAAAAQEAAASTPGRKLEVLPIGLGVFAGVSVIALIVVGLVTYERTKYRKLFRQRKLAESGANMGYGGMAERTR